MSNGSGNTRVSGDVCRSCFVPHHPVFEPSSVAHEVKSLGDILEMFRQDVRREATRYVERTLSSQGRWRPRRPV